MVRYASQNEAFLDRAYGRLDATLADIVNTEVSFIKTPAGQGFALVGLWLAKVAGSPPIRQGRLLSD